MPGPIASTAPSSPINRRTDAPVLLAVTSAAVLLTILYYSLIIPGRALSRRGKLAEASTRLDEARPDLEDSPG